jgi:hypothetical protein
VLAAIPAGRKAAWGIGLWSLPILAAWLAWAFRWPAVYTGDPRADTDTVWLTLIWTLPVALAAALQLLRPRLGRLYAAAALLAPVLVLALLLPPLAL